MDLARRMHICHYDDLFLTALLSLSTLVCVGIPFLNAGYLLEEPFPASQAHNGMPSPVQTGPDAKPFRDSVMSL